MDAFDKFWLAVRQYFFPILLILAGLIFILSGVSVDKATGLTQTNYFLFGGVAVFILGVVSLAFVASQKIPTFLILGVSVLLLVGVYFFTSFNVNSIKSRIKYENDVKASRELAKQGLVDIQKLQEEYDKNYRKFANSLDSLIYFAKNDSTSVLIRAEGDIPTRPMTIEEIKFLGFNAIKEPRRAEVISEEDALALGKGGFINFIREYKKVPVGDYLFSEEKQAKNNREYPFDVNRLKECRTLEGFPAQEFVLESYDPNAGDTTATEPKEGENPEEETVKQIHVKISAYPPYGPQVPVDIKDTLSVGSLSERKMNTNWK